MFRNRNILFVLFFLSGATLLAQQDSSEFWVRKSFWDRLFKSYPAELQEKNLGLAIYPEINQIYAGPQDWWRNGRGVSIEGNSKHFSFRSSFLEQQDTRPPLALSELLTPQMAVPGYGRWKTFKETGYDYTRIETEIQIQVHRNWRLSGGYTQNNYLPFANLQHSFNLFSYPTISSELTVARGEKIGELKLVNGYSQWSDFIRLPSTASGEAPFYSRLMNNAGLEYISSFGIKFYLGSLSISERYNLSGGKRQKSILAYQPMPIVAGFFSSSNEFMQHALNTRLSYQTQLLQQDLNISIEGYFQESRILSAALSVNISGPIVELKSGQPLSYKLGLHYWQRERDRALPSLFGYQILHAGISPAQSLLSGELSYQRLMMGLRFNRLEQYKFDPGNTTLNTLDTYAAISINPSYDFRLKLGRISHSELMPAGFFYVSLSTSFAPNYLDY